MAEGVRISTHLGFIILLTLLHVCNCQVLTPPTFNLAKGKEITATATCGIGVSKPELYCQLTGVVDENQPGLTEKEIIQGQLCDYCDPSDPMKSHPAKYAIDGSENYWQSPPLSRGDEYNQVDLEIKLGQEFHIAYIIIKMANSPRPGVWVLEKSQDYGETWEPWQYFADTPTDCLKFFQTPYSIFPERDDQILCSTEFSRIVPLVDGEIFLSLVNNRPSASNFTYADDLKQFMKATNVRMRLMRTKNLLGHLTGIKNQDPTVTRRYYYSIKDISLGGRCVCNGHADTCNYMDPEMPERLICDCQHNTVGDQCQFCDAANGFVQKKWQPARANSAFECEPCQCYNRAMECIYDAEVDAAGLSVDIHGFYNGGGVCQNCGYNSTGINCDECLPGYFRPNGVPVTDLYMCRPCECDFRYHINECAKGTGQCKCRPEYEGEYCERCAEGYYGYPDCIPCDCDVHGTKGKVCHVNGGQCPCKDNYVGIKCDLCQKGFYDFPECGPCECDPTGSNDNYCSEEGGQCACRLNYGSRNCSECANGFYNFPDCTLCDCDPVGTEEEVCDKSTGQCLCKLTFNNDRCDVCARGYYGYPDCMVCGCQEPGSTSNVCQDSSGQCSCKLNYAGQNCERCAAGYYRYPDCIPCECDQYGSLGETCDQETGQCDCRFNFQGLMCESCRQGLYNYPNCEECNCNPSGAKEVPGYPLGGCGEVVVGRLCECKERVIGRICDTCLPGYWNLHRHNPYGCEECGCSESGSISGLNMCDMGSGQCVCKAFVKGRICDTCVDGYYSLDRNNLFGCVECKCDVGGSLSYVCDKRTGQCPCKPRVEGRRCDQPIRQHFIPTLDQMKFEVEDGYTPEGFPVRFDYDERTFPNFSWRGYAILSKNQPEVYLDFDINKPSLYRLVYRFVNLNDRAVLGDVTLRPDSTQESPQYGQVLFAPSKDPLFADVGNTGGQLTFVLNPGQWTVMIKANNSIFLDYMFLIPQAYYEASVLQNTVYRPCIGPNDKGPCYHYSYPDVIEFPLVKGSDGYIVDGNVTRRVDLIMDPELLLQLDIDSIAILNASQNSFDLDLYIPRKDRYVLILNYYSDANRTETVLFNIGDEEQATAILYNCQYSSLCRQVLLGMDEMTGIFELDEGVTRIRITGDEDVSAGIESIVAIPYSVWSLGYIKPSIVCIRINGVCVGSRYATPTGSVRIEFESLPNDHLIAEVYPPGVDDSDIGLIRLNNTLNMIVLLGTARSPGTHKFLVHYYLPNEIGQEIPVTLFANGQEYTGTFTPRYCPGVQGCRDLILFDATGYSGNMDLSDLEVKIVFNNTSGQEIWLDYLLLIPTGIYGPTDVMVLPVDNSRNFIESCLDDGFKIRTPLSDFCEKSLFSLTTDFNNGALECDCDIDGSMSFHCDPFGGQCQCRPNVIGRTCSTCRVGYYGFPRCQPCNCPFGLCQQVTGQCICPPRVTGDRCDVCEPGTYGYDALIGCQNCGCNTQGVVDGDINCDADSGQCRCLPGIGGRKCDFCLAGFYSFPYCRECDCDRYGTTSDICNPNTAMCICRENVMGARCDQCRANTFNLEPTNPQGCTDCFCFGNTANCRESSYTWDSVSVMDGWGILNTVDGEVRDAGNVLAIMDAEDKILYNNLSMYWVAPEAFLGNKVRSYGGFLRYQVLYVLPRDENITVEALIEPDIVLTGNGGKRIEHTSPKQPYNLVNTLMEIQLFEYNFIYPKNGAIVDRQSFMMILNSLESLLIRGSYYSIVTDIRLQDVELDFAVMEGFGERAYSVEECACPRGYVGTSCEECATGYYRARTEPFLGICRACHCNGHAATCDLQTGICINCANNTMGDHCEMCLPGYYGDPATGGCSICGCPMAIESNNFADQCSVNENNVVTQCACYEGYTGLRCERCAPGYYGDPYTEGSTCQTCNCSDNLDLRDPEACDFKTGECLSCINNSTGRNCERCLDWFYGDAVEEKDCYPCSCNQCGSLMCDNDNGLCQCKPRVMGADCDRCEPDTYGFDECNGCTPCDCGEASVASQCDAYDGRCECMPGVTGFKCKQCMNGYWNYQETGCTKCNCEFDGAVTCDPVDGRCQCLPGVTGATCDTCLDRWVLIPQEGCQECDSCIDNLLDDVERMDMNISTIQDSLQTVSIGVAAMQRLDTVNASIFTLQPKVISVLYESKNISLDGVSKQQAMLDAEISSTIGQSEASISDADNLVETAEGFVVNSDDAIKLGDMSQRNATAAILYVNEILRQINEGIKVTNIETYITMSEQIIAELKGRNFTSNNDSIAMEIAEGESLLMIVKELQTEPDQLVLDLQSTTATLNNVNVRLRDLTANAETAEATSARALNLINELSFGPMEDMNIFREDILFTTEVTTNTIETSQDTLNMSVIDYDTAREKIDKVAEGLTMLKNGVSVLEEHNNKFDRLDDADKAVNTTEEHAEYLQNQAALLDNLYTDTREISQNAVRAGQAYQHIVDAIEDAREAAIQTFEAADSAAVDSSGVGDKSKNFTMSSEILLMEAKEKYNVTQTELTNRLTEALKVTLLAESKNRDTAGEVGKARDRIAASNTSEVRDKAEMVSAQGEDASLRADGTRSRVKDILDDLPKQLEKTIPLTTDAVNTNRDIQQTKNQVKSVNKFIPNIQMLLTELTDESDRIKSLGQTVKQNIAGLREKIAIARNQANLIRVGLDFLGNTSVQLRNPRGVSQAGSYSQVSLYFRTTSENGLLLYGGSEMSASNKPNQDYMALELENGQVVFKYDLNTGNPNGYVKLSHPHYVADGQWYKVTAKRIGKAGTLILEQDPLKGELGSVEGMSKGTYTVLDVHPLTSKFYAGGIPDGIELAPAVTKQNYVGVIEGIEFDDSPMGLWNFESGDNNYKGARERNVLTSVTSNGFRFDGNGFVILDTMQTGWKPAIKTQVSMDFKTYAEEGLLFFAGKDRDFISVELRAGMLLYQYDLGGGRASMTYPGKLNDGEWHNVQINRQNKTGVLFVDSQFCCQDDSPGTLSQLSVSEDIFIGGYQGIILPVSDVTRKGFDGCIKDVTLQLITWDLNDNKQSKGVIPGCPEQIARVATFEEEMVSYIANPMESIGRNFDMTFKMKTKQSRGLLLYVTNDDQSAGFSVSILDGKISLISDPGDERLILESRVNTYNDGRWHYISIMKKGRQLEMNIDDYERIGSEASGGKKVLATTSPLYFGNADISVSQDLVSTNEQFVGCVGDVTINGEFLNFAVLQDNQKSGISLAGCPIPDPVGLYDPKPVEVDPTTPPTTTTMAPTPPPGQCSMEVVEPLDLPDPDDVTSIFFGDYPNSRIEYDRLPSSLRIQSVMYLEFRTTVPDGVIFYFADSKHVDHVSLVMKDGMIRYTFNSGTGIGEIMTTETYNDGEWHTLSAARSLREGVLMVDGAEVGETESKGRARSINGRAPYYFGGLNPDINYPDTALKNLGGVTSSFGGCLANIRLKDESVKAPVRETGVMPCYRENEAGSYFYGDGGYIKLVDEFKVALDISIELEMRPRSLNGVLFSVHGDKGDFIILQLVKGELWLTADNGAGSIIAKFIPEMNNKLCDGGWHKVSAVKNKNVVMLTVDDYDTVTTTSQKSATSTDTNNPIYIGDKPDAITKGVRANGKYRGCIRNLIVNGDRQYLATGVAFSNVDLHRCPIN